MVVGKNKYTATCPDPYVEGKTLLLCSVYASSTSEAQVLVEEKLDVPGLRDCYFWWLRGGKKVDLVSS